jgi:hypothetical protein
MEDEVIDSTVEDSQPELTMDDTIRKTLEDIEARDGDSSRDDKGRFSSKESNTPADPEPTPAPAEPAAEDATPAEPVATDPVTEPTVPPELQRLGLRKEAAAAIAKDPVVMQEFIRRSDEMHRGLEQFREKAQFGDTIRNVIAPYMKNIESSGMTPDVAVQALFTADSMLRGGSQEQKVQMLHKLAADYGIDIQQAAQAQPVPFDGTTYALQQKLSQMEGWIAQQTQARQQQESATLNSEIERFSGDPANVHFAAVRDDMAGLLQAGMATDLRDAYEKAIYANPTVRAQVLAQQQAKADTDRKAQATQKAQAAKQAAAVNVSRKGTLPSAKQVGSIDDTIRDKARELGLI